MGLRRQIINLRRPYFRHNAHQRAGIRRVCIVKKEFNIIIGGMNQMVNPAGYGNAVTPYQTMHFIPFFQQKFRQIRTVLPVYSCNQSYVFHISYLSVSALWAFFAAAANQYII